MYECRHVCMYLCMCGARCTNFYEVEFEQYRGMGHKKRGLFFDFHFSLLPRGTYHHTYTLYILTYKYYSDKSKRANSIPPPRPQAAEGGIRVSAGKEEAADCAPTTAG